MTPETIYSRLATNLKKRRESKKLSRQKVARQMHVPLDTVISLENPSKSNVPESHLPGLYRTYAEILQLDDEKIDKLITKLTTGTPKTGKQSKKTKNTLIISSTIRRVAAGTIIMAIILYAGWQFGILFAPPPLSIDSHGSYTVVNEPRIEFKGKSDRNSTVFLNGEPIEVDENGDFSHGVYLQPGYNALDFSTSNNFGRQTNVRRIVILETD